MQPPTPRILAVLLACFAAEIQAYPMSGWPMPIYNQDPEQFSDDDYYDTPNQQYYYQPQVLQTPEAYEHVPYPYVNNPYAYYGYNKMPKGHEERLAALPIGQEIWYEDQSPHWKDENSEANEAFLNNLIIREMALDARRQRENAHAQNLHQGDHENSETERDLEDEDVRELKALADKPFYHVPKTVPRFEEEDEEDYPADEADADSFINWTEKKRSMPTKHTTTTAAPSTTKPKDGQKEVVLSGPGQTHNHLSRLTTLQHLKPNEWFYKNLEKNTGQQAEAKGRRIEKRYVYGENDLVYELRGLKHRIPT